MQFLPGLIIQATLIMLSVLLGIRLWSNYRRTKDESFKLFSIFFLLNTPHIGIYFFLQLYSIFLNDISLIHEGRIVARLLLNLGLVQLLKLPFITRSTPFLNNVVTTKILYVVILLSTYLQFIDSKNSLITHNGFIIENIELLPAVIVTLITPVLVAMVWFKVFFLDRKGGKGQKKVWIIYFAILIGVIGQVVYLTNKSETQSLVGVSLVTVSYFSLLLIAYRSKFFKKQV